LIQESLFDIFYKNEMKLNNLTDLLIDFNIPLTNIADETFCYATI